MRAWTRSVPVLTSGYRDATTDADGRGRQTYLSLVCGPDDVIHVVSRQIRLNTGLYYRGSTYFVLVHQKLSRGRHWSAPTFMVVPPEERRFHHRMVLISEDGGARWRFATAADFAAGMEPYAVEAQPHTAAGEQAGAGDTPAAQ